MKRATTRLALFAALLSLPGPAIAGGITVTRFGGELGVPTAENLTAIYYNPAGLAFGHGTRLFADGQLILRHLSYDRPEGAISNPNRPPGGDGTPTDGLSANSGKATLNNFITLPFFAIGSDLGVKNLGVALGLYVPFGGQAIWDKNQSFKGNTQFPGAVDGVQRWAVIAGTIKSVYITGAGAYQVLPGLGLGVGVNLVSSTVQTTEAKNSDGTDDLLDSSGRLKEGRAYLNTDNTSLALGGGILWEPGGGWRLGLSYQSQPGFGELRYHGTLETVFSTRTPDTEKVIFSQSLPDIWRAGAAWRTSNKLELRASFGFERWSVMTHQCIFTDDAKATCAVAADGSAEPSSSPIKLNIPRNWKNGWNVRGGFSYWFSDPLQLAVGVEYDKNVVPDATADASLIDLDKLVPGAQLVWDSGSLVLSANFTEVIYFSRTVPVSAVQTLLNPSKVPSGAGNYDQSVSMLIVGAGYHF